MINFRLMMRYTRRILRFSFLMYNILTLSYRIAFLTNFDKLNNFKDVSFQISIAIDYIIDILYTVDCLILFRNNSESYCLSTVPVNTSINTSRISNTTRRKGDDNQSFQYFPSMCNVFFQLVMVFPFEIVAYLCGMERWYWLRLLRLIRVSKMSTYWTDLCALLEKSKIVTDTILQRILFLTILAGLLGHVAACIFYAIGLDILYKGHDRSWLTVDGLVEVVVDALSGERRLVFLHTVEYRYLRAMYWSVQTLYTVGFGDIVAHTQQETWFCIFYFLLSACLIYMCIANLVMFVTNSDSARTLNLLKVARFDRYAAYRKLPPDLTKKVRSFYAYQWQLLRGVDEAQILSELPTNISQQVVQCLVRDLLMTVPVFRSLNKGLVNAVTEFVETYTYSPGDVIIEASSPVTGVYVISTGDVQILNTFYSVVGVMSRGESFGGSALLNTYKTQQQYRAKSFVELMFLRGSVFRNISRMHDCDVSDLIKDSPEQSSNALDLLASRKSNSGFASVKNSFKSSFNFVLKSSRISPAAPVSPSVPKGRFSLVSRPFESRNQTIITLQRNRALTHADKSWRRYFAPDEPIRLLWDALVLACMMFYVMSVALLLAGTMRQRSLSHYHALYVTSYVVDLVMFVDFLCKLTVFSYLDKGIVVNKTKQICAHFFSQYNPVLSLAVVLPVDVALGFALSYRAVPVARLLKLMHLLRVTHYLKNLQEVLRIYCGVTLSFEMSRFLALYVLLFFLCHWVGCLWQLTADVSVAIFDCHTSWRIQDAHGAVAVDYYDMSGTVPYFRSIYWAANVMSSIGYTDILTTNSVETSVVIVVIFFGYLMFNTLLGALASLMSNFNREKREFSARVDRVKQLMASKRIPVDLEARILRYYEYVWTRYGGVNEVEVLDSLPRALRADVANYVMGPLVARIPFFGMCGDQTQQVIVSLLRPRIFLHDDIIVTGGEIGKEMFIIEKGSVQVTSADRTVTYTTLSDGAYIGESCLLDVSRRTASAYAVGYVDTYYLSNDGFHLAFEKFPQEYVAILNFIKVTLLKKRDLNTQTAEAAANELCAEENDSKNLSLMPPAEPALYTTKVPSNATITAPAKAPSRLLSILDCVVFCGGKVPTVLPDSRYKVAWDVVIFLTLLYYAIMIPLRIAVQIKPASYIFDAICDVLNVADIYLYSSVFAAYSGGQLLLDTARIRSKYCNSKRLLVDLVAVIPFELICLAYLSDTNQLLFALSLLRLPRMVKLCRINSYYAQVETVAKALKVYFVAMRFIELTCVLLVSAHWTACVLYLFAEYGQSSDDCASLPESNNSTAGCRYAGTWVELQIGELKLPPDGGDQWSRYLRAFNWALPTLTSETIGDVVMRNAKESLFAFFVIFFGLSINGAVIGSIMSIVSDANEEATKVFRRMETLRTYLSERMVSPMLIATSTELLRHIASPEGALTVSQDVVFSELPHSLKILVDQHLKTIPYLRRCPFFDFCNDEVLRGISAKLRVKLFAKGDKIVTYGDLGNEMFFLESGSVHVLSGDSSTLFSTLEQGAFFGETGLFFRTPRVATIVVSSAFCICMVLSKTDLTDELRACDYNDEEVLESFKLLQLTNQNRNEALSHNLAVAKTDNESKLHKLIRQDSGDIKLSTSWLHRLRQFMAPDRSFRTVWDVLGSIFLVYYVLSIPLYIAFLFGEKVRLYLQYIAIDFLIDGYWCVDILLKLYAFPFKSDVTTNKIVTDSDAIKARYLSSGYFYHDVCASIPFELVGLLPGSPPIVFFTCRVVHLLRVAQLPDYLALVGKHVLNNLRVSVSRSASLLLKAGFAYLVLTHLIACVYFMIHRYAERHVALTYVIADGLAEFDPISGEHDICTGFISFCYARSIYFVLGAMTSIGYGDISPFTNKEIMWEQMVAILGAYMAAAFVGFCSTYWEDSDSTSDASFKNKLKQVEHYISFRRLRPDLGGMMLSQYRHMWATMHSLHGDNVQLFDQLSEPCRIEIMLSLHSDVIDKVPVLSDLPYQIKRRFAAALKPQVALQGSHLYRAGDVGHSLFFVSTGQISVTLSSDASTLDSYGLHALKLLLHKQLCHGVSYTAGTHFGECCLISKTGLRVDSAEVTQSGEVFAVKKADLWALFQFVTSQDRRSIVHSLFTRVGEKIHLSSALSEEPPASVSPDEEHIRHLYSMSFQILTECNTRLPDHLAATEQGESDGEDDSGSLMMGYSLDDEKSRSVSPFKVIGAEAEDEVRGFDYDGEELPESPFADRVSPAVHMKRSSQRRSSSSSARLIHADTSVRNIMSLLRDKSLHSALSTRTLNFEEDGSAALSASRRDSFGTPSPTFVKTRNSFNANTLQTRIRLNTYETLDDVHSAEKGDSAIFVGNSPETATTSRKKHSFTAKASPLPPQLRKSFTAAGDVPRKSSVMVIEEVEHKEDEEVQESEKGQPEDLGVVRRHVIAVVPSADTDRVQHTKRDNTFLSDVSAFDVAAVSQPTQRTISHSEPPRSTIEATESRNSVAESPRNSFGQEMSALPLMRAGTNVSRAAKAVHLLQGDGSSNKEIASTSYMYYGKISFDAGSGGNYEPDNQLQAFQQQMAHSMKPNKTSAAQPGDFGISKAHKRLSHHRIGKSKQKPSSTREMHSGAADSSSGSNDGQSSSDDSSSDSD